MSWDYTKTSCLNCIHFRATGGGVTGSISRCKEDQELWVKPHRCIVFKLIGEK
jgi:hypothetical protein